MTTAELISLVLSIFAITITVVRWLIDIKRGKAQQRLYFLRELFGGFSPHNWKFIEHWDFPGVYPPLKEIKIEAKTEKEKEALGLRVVTLDHVNILLQVFTFRRLLNRNDIQGFACWARSWFDESQPALKKIFESGELYPLDFDIWLRDVIFAGEPFLDLMGGTLKERLSEFEGKPHR